MFFLGGGWTTGTAGTLKYDWEGEQWTVPLNLVLSKTVKLGKIPWRFGLEANYYIERSDLLGPQWMIGFNVSRVVPNIFAQWLGATK